MTSFLRLVSTPNCLMLAWVAGELFPTSKLLPSARFVPIPTPSPTFHLAHYPTYLYQRTTPLSPTPAFWFSLPSFLLPASHPIHTSGNRMSKPSKPPTKSPTNPSTLTPSHPHVIVRCPFVIGGLLSSALSVLSSNKVMRVKPESKPNLLLPFFESSLLPFIPNHFSFFILLLSNFSSSFALLALVDLLVAPLSHSFSRCCFIPLSSPRFFLAPFLSCSYLLFLPSFPYSFVLSFFLSFFLSLFLFLFVFFIFLFLFCLLLFLRELNKQTKKVFVNFNHECGQ